MAKVMLTPDQFADKHARNLKASIQDIQQGINNVTEAPTAKAAKAQTKMLQNLTNSVNSGKWAARLNSVSVEDWKSAAINKGLPRIASGIDGARAKVVDFASQLLPYEANLQAQVTKLPNLTLEDSINRMTTFVRGMAKFQRK